jgi:micrococcal nuclease
MKYERACALLALAVLAGCPKAGFVRQPVGADAGTEGPNNAFEGELVFDDDLVGRLDPTTLGRGSAPCCSPLLGRVTRVVDGDTIHVRSVVDGVETTVRLIGVNAPEIAHTGTEADCYGPEAQTFTQLLNGRLVWLTFDAGLHDPFDRSLAYVWIGNGEGDMWNRQLARRGFAAPLSIQPNVTFARTFDDDVQLAKDAQTGMWKDCR